MIFAKVLRGNSERRTRFHTERGTLLPSREWLRLPGVFAGRFRAAREAPWLAPPAVRHLSRVVRPDWQIVECGAGMSTLWFAKRAAHVTSFEHDAAWHSKLRQHLDHNGVTNVDLRHIQLAGFIPALEGLLDATVDLAIVDSSEEGASNRIACVEALTNKVRPGGLLVLDDSDRRGYRVIDGILANWPVQRFVGIKGRPFLAVETSIYTRPTSTQGPASASGNSCPRCH